MKLKYDFSMPEYGMEINLEAEYDLDELKFVAENATKELMVLKEIIISLKSELKNGGAEEIRAAVQALIRAQKLDELELESELSKLRK